VLSLSEYPPEEGVRIKPVSRVLEPYPALTTEQIELARWMQQSYHCVLVDALRLMIPAQLARRTHTGKETAARALAEELEPQAALASLRKWDGSAKRRASSRCWSFCCAWAGRCPCRISRAFAGRRRRDNGAYQKRILEEDACVTFRRPSGGCGQEAPLLALTSEQQTAVDTIGAEICGGCSCCTA
jgi:primosomal protein N'